MKKVCITTHLVGPKAEFLPNKHYELPEKDAESIVAAGCGYFVDNGGGTEPPQEPLADNGGGTEPPQEPLADNGGGTEPPQEPLADNGGGTEPPVKSRGKGKNK